MTHDAEIKSQIFSSDSPLLDPANDTLGLAPFSRLLAQSISGMCPKEGIVVAINGAWGSGKSTALNFVLHYIENEYVKHPMIPIHFNPWWFSGREDLTRLLIGQIRARLGDKDYGELKGKLADFTDLITRIPGVPGKDAGEFIADKLRGEPDLVSLKNRIDDLLHSSNSKILVVIDDIDRLAPEEICDLFRTIKATGKFPNVIYLLAFDIDVVVHSLERTFIDNGHDYLEKIVQVPFALPMPDKVSLRKLLFANLNQLISDTDESSFDTAYWTNIYFGGIDHFIFTPRDVIRLTNVLRATYPCVKNEVNPVDFFAIESIRVFMPKLYDEIRRHQDLLAGAFNDAGNTSTIEQRKKMFDAWLKLIPEDGRDSAIKLLSLVFPKFGSAFGEANYGSDWLQGWRKELRACSPDKFPIYFQFAVSADSISKMEIDAVLDSAGDSRKFGEMLLMHARQIRSDGISKARAILEYLQDYTQKDIPEQNISPIITSLFCIGDQLLLKSDEPQGILDFGNDIRISRLIHQLLQRLSEQTRFEIVFAAIQEGSAISVIVRETAIWGKEHGKFGREKPYPEEKRTFTLEHLNAIESMVVDKIREAAEDGSLISSPGLIRILYSWIEWAGSDKEVKTFVSNIIATDEGLLSLLVHFGSVRRIQGLGDLAVRKIYRLDPKWLEPFVDPSEVVDRIRKMKSEPEIDPEKMQAVLQFLHEYDLRMEGKNPEDLDD